MAIKLKIPRGKGIHGHLSHPAVKASVAGFIIICMMLFGVFAYYYVKYQKIVDKRLHGPIFANSAKIYAAPETVRVGETLKAEAIAAELRRAGYTEESERNGSRIGSYKEGDTYIEVRPGPESYHTPEAATIHFTSGKIDRINQQNGAALDAYELEPQLVTGLFDRENRSKRRLITYDDMPPVLVNAILSIEDRRFFQHSGVNYYRLAEAVLLDLRGHHKQGGSTLTMQLARGFFLTPQQTVKRKLEEMLIAVELEQRLSKKQILELYVNQVDMGQRGSFAIKGFGEASQAYFGKDIGDLTLPEATLLAGIVNGPTYFSPYRHPDRAMERRNLVIQAMVENEVISQAQADQAKATPLKLAAPNVEASDAPYFVDMVRESLLSEYKDTDLNDNGYRIYTSLDLSLQKAAADAIDSGMKLVDDQVRKQRTRKVREGKGKSAKVVTTVRPGPDAQVALVCIDPHTGAVLALAGGRNYGQSQLNHALASRPTGSIFKPFVFAAAVNSALNGAQLVFTPASIIDDAPTVFQYEDKIYTPKNFEDKYFGPVSASFALAHSLNNATVKVAEAVGYDKVAALARAAGIKSVRATPAMAIGSYDATPMEMAGAYTVFANNGTRISPIFVTSVRDAKGDIIQDFNTDSRQVLDPRVAYVITTMMEGVMNYGTAAAVRGRDGFTAPAAGKTGTSHDGWFAGYTTNLLCIVWIGYDDYSDLKLEGSRTAAPIWSQFMKRAIALPQYKDGVKPFSPPPGVVEVSLDKVTNYLATPVCPNDYPAAFIAGTEPRQTCEMTAGDQRGFFQKLFGVVPKPPAPPVADPSQQAAQIPPGAAQPGQAGQRNPANDDDSKKKKGFFGKIFGAIKGDNTSQTQPQSSPPPAAPR